MIFVKTKNIGKGIALSLVMSLVFLLSFIPSFVFAATPCPTPAVGTTLTLDQQENCVLGDLGLDTSKTDLSSFVPKFGIEDIVGSIITILFALLIIFFVIQIVIAGFKWVNNDAQDKSKKEAIKKITGGVTGIIVAIVAFIIITIAQTLIFADSKIINCSNLYFANYTSYIKNSSASGYNDPLSNMTDDFRRCITLTGKDYLFRNHSDGNASIQLFYTKLQANCFKYTNIGSANYSATNVLIINDRQALNKCFVDQLKATQNEYKLP